MRLLFVLGGVLLAACGGPSRQASNPIQPGTTALVEQIRGGEPADEAAPARPRPYRADWQYVRREWFAGLPREAQDELLKYEKENSLCRGGSGGNRSTLRACNRREGLFTGLMKLGWCWGGAHTEAYKRWLPCSEDPDYDSTSLRRVEPPYFSEADIEEANEDEPQIGSHS